MSPARGSLFAMDVPDGFRYYEAFLTAEEETLPAEQIAGIAFSTFEMRGYMARRRVAFFGRSYDAGAGTGKLPAFLLPLREKIAVWADISGDAFAMALINESSPGAPIGWHRDAPQCDIVAGVSLLSSCRMKFRPQSPTDDSDRTLSAILPDASRRVTATARIGCSGWLYRHWRGTF